MPSVLSILLLDESLAHRRGLLVRLAGGRAWVWKLKKEPIKRKSCVAPLECEGSAPR